MSTSTTRPRSHSTVSGSELSHTGASSSADSAPWMESVVDTRSSLELVAIAAEQAEQEQKDVEDVEEDARRDHHGAAGIGPPQPVEVEDRERAEDPESGDGVDDVAVGDRDEDRHDPERDQAQQRPEQRARQRREVTPGGVPVRATSGDERRGRSGRLPQRGGVGLGVVGDDRRDRESEQQAQPEEQADRQLLAALGGGGIESEQARERAEEQHQPGAAAQIAAEVSAERGQGDRDGDEPHHLPEQPPRLVARDRLDGERPVVVGGLEGAHVTTPPRGTGRRAGGSR